MFVDLEWFKNLKVDVYIVFSDPLTFKGKQASMCEICNLKER